MTGQDDMVWVVATDKDVLLFDDERLATSVKGSIADRDPKMFSTTVDAWTITEKILVPEYVHVADFRGHKLEWTSDEPPQRKPPEGINQLREQLREDIANLFPDVPRELLIPDGENVTDAKLDSDDKKTTIHLQRIIPAGGNETALEIWHCKPPAPDSYYRVIEDEWAIVGDLINEDNPHYGKQYTFIRDIYKAHRYKYETTNDADKIVDTNQLHHSLELIPDELCESKLLHEDHNPHLHVVASGLKWCWSTFDQQPYQMDGYIGHGGEEYRRVVQAIRTERRHMRTNGQPVYADFIRPNSQVREIWFCPQPNQYWVSRDVWSKAVFASPMYDTIRYVYDARSTEEPAQYASPVTLFDNETVIKERCAKQARSHDPHVWVNKDYLVGRYRWCDGTQTTTVDVGRIDDPYMEASVLVRQMVTNRRLSDNLYIPSERAFYRLVAGTVAKLVAANTANDIIDGYHNVGRVVQSFWHNESELANQFSKMPAENVADTLMLVIGLFYEMLMPGWNKTTRELNSGAGLFMDKYTNTRGSLVGQLDEHLQPHDEEEDDD